jgi:HK97 gp10 family phage protein
MSVQGVEQLQKNLAKMAERYGKAVADSLLVSGEMVRGTAIKSIQQKSNGAMQTRYRAGGGSYQHMASAPNSPPNTDTGRLVSSVVVEVQQDDVYVGSSLFYAPHLEFGTKNMTQRPWLNPALEQNRKRISKLISDAVKKTTDKGVT